MNKEEFKKELALALISSDAATHLTGYLIAAAADQITDYFASKGVYTEEKFCEHGFISESFTCSNSDCDNFDNSILGSVDPDFAESFEREI